MRRYLFTAAILSLCVLGTSCSNESPVLDDGRFFMELTFSDASPSTRTYGPTIEDLSQERAISDLSVYFVNKHEPYTIFKINGISFDTEHKRSALIPIPIERQGIYNMYVVSNSGNNSAFTARTGSESDFIGKYGPYPYADAKKFWAPNQFMMVNVQNEVNGNAGVEVNLTGEHPMDNPLKVSVELERLALKVVVKEDESLVPKPVADGMILAGTEQNRKLVSMKVNGVCLMNCATNINLIQKWAPATGWTANGTPKGWPELLLDSPTSSLDPLYPIGPTGYYNRWADIVTPTYEISEDIEFVATGAPMYCFENNSPYYENLPDKTGSTIADYAKAKTKMKGRTTAAVIRVRCLFLNSGYLTEDLAEDPEEGLWTRAQNDDLTFYQYNGVYYGDLALLQSKNPELSGISTVSALRTAGVKVFEDGLMYYVHWIKDVNYKDDSQNYYSVMRNTYYGLDVTSIEDFGEDVPGGRDYNEFDPIDVEDNPLKANSVVRDWTIFEIHHTL